MEGFNTWSNTGTKNTYVKTDEKKEAQDEDIILGELIHKADQVQKQIEWNSGRKFWKDRTSTRWDLKVEKGKNTSYTLASYYPYSTEFSIKTDKNDKNAITSTEFVGYNSSTFTLPEWDFTDKDIAKATISLANFINSALRSAKKKWAHPNSTFEYKAGTIQHKDGYRSTASYSNQYLDIGKITNCPWWGKNYTWDTEQLHKQVIAYLNSRLGNSSTQQNTNKAETNGQNNQNKSLNTTPKTNNQNKNPNTTPKTNNHINTTDPNNHTIWMDERLGEIENTNFFEITPPLENSAFFRNSVYSQLNANGTVQKIDTDFNVVVLNDDNGSNQLKTGGAKLLWIHVKEDLYEAVIPLPVGYEITKINTSVTVLKDEYWIFKIQRTWKNHLTNLTIDIQKTNTDHRTSIVLDNEQHDFLGNAIKLPSWIVKVWNNAHVEKIRQTAESIKHYILDNTYYSSSIQASNSYQQAGNRFFAELATCSFTPDQHMIWDCDVINAYFVWLCRKAGIPARMIAWSTWSSQVWSSHHARAEYYDGSKRIQIDATPCNRWVYQHNDKRLTNSVLYKIKESKNINELDTYLDLAHKLTTNKHIAYWNDISGNSNFRKEIGRLVKESIRENRNLDYDNLPNPTQQKIQRV